MSLIDAWCTERCITAVDCNKLPKLSAILSGMTMIVTKLAVYLPSRRLGVVPSREKKRKKKVGMLIIMVIAGAKAALKKENINNNNREMKSYWPRRGYFCFVFQVVKAQLTNKSGRETISCLLRLSND